MLPKIPLHMYLVFLSRNRVVLCKLLSKLKSEWEGFYQDFEGDGALVLLLGDGDLGADGHHHLPGNQRDTSGREELLKVLIPVQMIRPKQLFHHDRNQQWLVAADGDTYGFTGRRDVQLNHRSKSQAGWCRPTQTRHSRLACSVAWQATTLWNEENYWTFSLALARQQATHFLKPAEQHCQHWTLGNFLQKCPTLGIQKWHFWWNAQTETILQSQNSLQMLEMAFKLSEEYEDDLLWKDLWV